jgi:tetratricopeptide (TPR) repeat protein
MRKELRALRELVSRIEKAEDGDVAGHVELLEQLHAECARAGVRSAWAQWRLGIALDQADSPERALPLVEAALAVDPLAPPFLYSRAVVVGRLRKKLLAAAPAEAPALYQLLTAGGDADEECHLAMARHFAAAGDQVAALRLLEALTILSPGNPEVWTEYARVARLAGREELARAAEVEAALRPEGGFLAPAALA